MPVHISPAPHVLGEVFDITCFAGINQFHCLRVEGRCSAAHLSSQHMRSVDFECMCNIDFDKEGKAVDRKAAFEAATREKYLTCITYQATVHLAWEADENHERITPNSFACMQSRREDYLRMETMPLDPQADIVTMIIDVVTDKLHFHLVKAKSGSSLEGKVMLARPTAFVTC